jgi:indole-3-glycerol phosphate synthase
MLDICSYSTHDFFRYSNSLHDIIKRYRRKNRVAYIVEYKRASPLEIINTRLSLRDFYYGLKDIASAFSIHVDSTWFFGSPKHIMELRLLGWKGPILAKGFIFYDLQIDLYKKCGASTILLISSALEDYELAELYTYAINSDVEPLIEVNSVEEVERVFRLTDPLLIGVNSRDLRTLEIRRDRMYDTIRFIRSEYPDVFIVAESGVRSISDLEEYVESGADSILIGTFLMKNIYSISGFKHRLNGIEDSLGEE